MRHGSRTAVAVGVSACAVALLTGGCGSLKQVGAGVHRPAAKDYTITARVTTVVIDTSGSITVTGSSRGTVAVSEQPSYSKTPPATSRQVSGSTLTLGYTCKTQLVCSVAYDVQVPRDVAVRATSREGSVTLTSLAGPVTAQTFAGLITATALASPSTVLKTTAGGVDATFSVPPRSLQASTNAGPITIAVPDSVAYEVSAHTYVGATTDTVRHSAAAAHVITARSDLGSITIGPS